MSNGDWREDGFDEAICAIEAEAAQDALMALREKVEAEPTQQINWYDADGLHEEHADAVKQYHVLALIDAALDVEPAQRVVK